MKTKISKNALFSNFVLKILFVLLTTHVDRKENKFSGGALTK